MSPEQARGDLDRLGPRSDVYSLGATLYCLLTGVPPFDDKDPGAVLTAVQKGAFPPPRQRDPSIDRALEAVCVKAMALKPEDRYASPRLLADDLERWTADEPVFAWREPFSRRAQRWGRRNRTLVATAAMLVGTAVVALAVGTWLISREQALTKRAYLSEARQRAEAQRQRQRAEVRSQQARKAVDEMYTDVAEKWLASQPRMEGLQREFLEKARDYYEEFAKEADSDPSVRRGVELAHQRMGEIEFKLGNLSEAERAFLKALDVNKERRPAPSERDPRADQADILGRLGRVYIRLARMADEEKVDRQAIELYSQLERDVPSQPRYRQSRAVVLSRTGLAYQGNRGRSQDAEPAYRAAIEIQEELLKQFPGLPNLRKELADTRHNMGTLLVHLGRLEEAERSVRRGIEIYEQIINEPGDHAVIRREAANSYILLGVILENRGQIEQSERVCRRSIELIESLVLDFPKVPDYRNILATVLNNLGNILKRLDRSEDAKKAFYRSIEVTEALVSAFPNTPEYRVSVCRSHSSLGNLLQDLREVTEADRAFVRSIAIGEQLVSDFTNVPQYRILLATVVFNRGDALLTNGDTTEAASVLRHAMVTMDTMVAEIPDAPAVEGFEVNLLRGAIANKLGEIAAEHGLDESRKLHEAAIGNFRRCLQLVPESPEAHRMLASSQLDLAQALLDLGERAEASSAFREARATLDRYASLSTPSNWDPFTIACGYALLSAQAGKSDPVVSAEEGQADAERAMNELRRAMNRGGLNGARLRTAPDLDSLRSRADFQWLLLDLAFPAQPFAAPME
jgi:serine/threonine-protein kinase